MGSTKYAGIRFSAYPNDHPPRHVHGSYDGAVAIVELREGGEVALAARKDAIRPGNAKRTAVTKILATAAIHYDELIELWEKAHEG